MSLYSKEEIEFSKIRVKNFLSLLLDKDRVLFLEGKRILTKSKLQALLKTKLSQSIDQIILELIVENAYKAESISPGGFQKTLESIVNEEETIDLFENYHPRKKDIETIVKDCMSPTEAEILISAIELAGFGGKITIEKSQNENASVELVNSYFFQCLSHQDKSVKLVKPRVLVVDGYVESVAEINLLLESLTNTGYQLVLIARGYHPDVINTVKINNERKVISVYLVEIPFDIDGINTLVDMSIVTSCELISSNLGQLISSISVKNSVEVDEINLTKNKIAIKKNSTKNAVKNHVQELINKLKTRQEISEIYEKRISCLTGDSVVIRIPDDQRFVEISTNFDYCLRMIKSLISYGISSNGCLTHTRYASNIFSKKAKECIEGLGYILHSK